MPNPPFYNAQIARVGNPVPNQPPDITNEGVPPLADPYGRFITLVDGTTNVHIESVQRYPTIHGSTAGFVNEGSIGDSSMRALIRVWGMNNLTQLAFFQIRLVDSVLGTGVIVASIPVEKGYASFNQDCYIDFKLNGVTYDTMYFNMSTSPDTVVLPLTPSLWLNFAYLGVNPVSGPI